MRFDIEDDGFFELFNVRSDLDAVRLALGSVSTRFLKGPESMGFVEDYSNLDMHIYFGADSKVQGVEFFRGSSFFLQGHSILGEAVALVLEYLEDIGELVSLNDSGFDIRNRRVRFFAPDIGEEDAVVKAVYVVACSN